MIVAHAEKNEVSSAAAAVELGLIAASEVPFQLKNQSLERAAAAVEDIRTIIKSGMQEQPNWLDVHFSNSRSHQEGKETTTTDGAVAVANIAQNIVLLANHHPEWAEELEEAVIDAYTLVRGLGDLQSASNLSKEKRKQLWERVVQALRLIVEKSGEVLLDTHGGIVDIEEFLRQRSADVEGPHDRLVHTLSIVNSGNESRLKFDKGSKAWLSTF
ncbi:MAG: hypothetical protein SFX19_08215 [Alphaproteobacteria bacterium]|nr:hypothetical protein [Alphaproteobacteria bacterium]